MNRRFILIVLFFGSLWGTWEALMGDFLHRAHVPHGSIYLSIGAFFFLALARGFFNKKWSSTAIGAIAMLYRILNTPFYACHLLAIFLLGACFDLISSLLFKKESSLLKLAYAGALSVYLGFASFAISITYIFRYHWWIQAGWQKVMSYVVYNGTWVAISALFMVPCGFYLGQMLGGITARKDRGPAFAYSIMGGLTVLCWVLGFLKP